MSSDKIAVYVRSPVKTGPSRLIRSVKKKTFRTLLSTAHNMKLFSSLRRRLPSNLGVLAYHRIADPNHPRFVGFKSNVSATLQAFSEQLDYLKGECNVLSLDDLTAVVRDGKELPENAVLITFDDGYRDNFTTALPALVQRRLPAVLFATTGFLDGFIFPFWDWVTEAFVTARVEAAILPLLGKRKWRTRPDREHVALEWIKAGISRPHPEFRDALLELSRALGEPLPFSPPPGHMMNWDELRTMIGSGFSIGSHTVTHPVLQCVNSDRALGEIKVSKALLERRTGARVTSFAYPNGLFSQEHERMLEDVGFTFGFRVEGGLSFKGELSDKPFAIRRTCINLKDDMPRFAAKVAGMARLNGSLF